MENPKIPQTEKVFQCDHCEKKFGERKQSVWNHIAAVHLQLRPYECNVCKDRFFYFKNLQIHQVSMHQTKTMKCDVCEATFGQKINMQIHIIRLHMDKHHQFQCDLCDKRFTLSVDLERHKSTVHMKDKPFVCDACPMKFNAKKDLAIHCMAMHVKPKLAYKRKAGHMTCDVCDAQLATKLSLIKHIRTKHTNRERFPCELCRTELSSFESLRLHISKIHKGVQCQCDVCGKMFKYKVLLRRHVRVHERSRYSIDCTICTSTFTRRDALQHHIAKMHGGNDNSVVCDHCDTKFNHRDNLPKHMTDFHSPSLEL